MAISLNRCIQVIGNKLTESFAYTTLTPDQVSGKALALDIAIRSNLLSYTVYARERQLLRIIATELDQPLAENETQFTNWVRNDEWLGMKFGQINIVWSDARFSLVPADYARPQHAASLARYLFETDSFELLRFSDAGERQLLYPVNEKIYYAIRSRFPDANHEHVACRILNWYMDPSIDQDFLVVNHGDYLQVLYRDGDKLQFCQSFPYSTAGEGAYFVLNTMEKLSIHREKIGIRTLGLAEESELFQNLDTYIRKVKGWTIPLPEALKKAHTFHPLLIAKL
ncbi:MAG: DUF3822 family protein [Bacteroidia bacterium]